MRPAYRPRRVGEIPRGADLCCSACLAGEVPALNMADGMQKAEEAILWHKTLFGDDYYLELQLHKASSGPTTKPIRCSSKVNRASGRVARETRHTPVCTNDALRGRRQRRGARPSGYASATGKDLDDPKRMLYSSKQKVDETAPRETAIFGDIPEAPWLRRSTYATRSRATLSTTPPSCRRSKFRPSSAPRPGTASDSPRKSYSTSLRATRTGNVTMSEGDAKKKIDKLGGYDRLYRIKLEADYLTKLTMDGAQASVTASSYRRTTGAAQFRAAI